MLLFKNGDYTKEIVISVLFAVIMILFIYFVYDSAEYPYVTLEKEPIYVEAKTLTGERVDPGYSIGITEFMNSIEVEPIQVDDLIEEIDPVVTYNFELTGYVNVNTELNIRSKPNTSSDIVGKLNWMDEVQYSVVNDDWACIKLDDSYGFIASRYITGDYETYTKTCSISGDKAKSYMDYRTITLKTSDQYKLQQRASTNDDNGLRILRGRYMVALGSYFNCNVGQFIDVVLSDGVILPCIVGDAKQDIHTDSQNLHGLNGDTVEFIVNETVLKDKTDVVGNISYVSDVFDGKVVEIRTYDHVEH